MKKRKTLETKSTDIIFECYYCGLFSNELNEQFYQVRELGYACFSCYNNLQHKTGSSFIEDFAEFKDKIEKIIKINKQPWVGNNIAYCGMDISGNSIVYRVFDYYNDTFESHSIELSELLKPLEYHQKIYDNKITEQKRQLEIQLQQEKERKLNRKLKRKKEIAAKEYERFRIIYY